MTTFERFKQLESYLENNKDNISENEKSKIITYMVRLTSKMVLDALEKNKVKDAAL